MIIFLNVLLNICSNNIEMLCSSADSNIRLGLLPNQWERDRILLPSESDLCGTGPQVRLQMRFEP